MSQKKKEQKKLKTEDQQTYVDPNRSIAVSLDSKELSRAFKGISRKLDHEEMNRGLVNSLLYEKQATHFSKKNKRDSAIKYFSLGTRVLKVKRHKYKVFSSFLGSNRSSYSGKLGQEFPDWRKLSGSSQMCRDCIGQGENIEYQFHLVY